MAQWRENTAGGRRAPNRRDAHHTGKFRETVSLEFEPTLPRNRAALSLGERIEIDFAKLCQDHRVLKLACRRIAGARERQGARVFERERASPAFGHDRTNDLLSFAGLQFAFLIPVESEDNMIGHGHIQAGFRFSAEDFPLRLSATIS
jgi:hypothetical protein